MCEALCLDLDFCLVRFQLSVECLFSLHMALIGRCSCDDGVSRGLRGFHWLCAFRSPCFARTWLYVCVSMHHVFLVCCSCKNPVFNSVVLLSDIGSFTSPVLSGLFRLCFA